MEIIKSNNGFPYAWKAGRVEQLIRQILETKIKQQLNVDRAMIINPTWLHENDLAAQIVSADPGFVICHNFVDPAVPKIFEAVEQCGRPNIIIGNADQYRLDFWAMVCDLYFRDYPDYEVAPLPDARKFICLNRKPHQHRVALVERLLTVKEQGYISLGLPGDRALTIDTDFDPEQGINDEFGNMGTDEGTVSRKIKNDIFSLGDLHNWNRSLLCIVTETEFSNTNPDNFFMSEKTWKPVLGLRPFFVYGQPRLRDYLKEQGFDIFEDIFDYSIVNERSGDREQQQQYAQVALNGIAKINNPYQDYQKYFYRCVLNRIRFHAYVYEQWDRLNNLDLTQYV
jgi:hypothetical protein